MSAQWTSVVNGIMPQAGTILGDIAPAVVFVVALSVAVFVGGLVARAFRGDL